jgi:hypothetical protein
VADRIVVSIWVLLSDGFVLIEWMSLVYFAEGDGRLNTFQISFRRKMFGEDSS